jgi:hypothetical protein
MTDDPNETVADAVGKALRSPEQVNFERVMPDPTHPLALLKGAAAAWVATTPGIRVHDKFTLSMRATRFEDGTVGVGGVVLRPEYAIEDLRYEVGEWDDKDVLVEVLGRASSLDGAKALLEAEHRKAPGKVLVLRERMRIIDRRGTGSDGGR